MRRSADYYPEYVDFTCEKCWTDHEEVEVNSIWADDVCVYCPECDEPTYVQVID